MKQPSMRQCGGAWSGAADRHCLDMRCGVWVVEVEGSCGGCWLCGCIDWANDGYGAVLKITRQSRRMAHDTAAFSSAFWNSLTPERSGLLFLKLPRRSLATRIRYAHWRRGAFFGETCCVGTAPGPLQTAGGARVCPCAFGGTKPSAGPRLRKKHSARWRWITHENAPPLPSTPHFPRISRRARAAQA